MVRCPVIVLGSPRSGTSLVAGVLHLSGIGMGGGFSPPDAQNPSGYWEDRHFADHNALYLALTGKARDHLNLPTREEMEVMFEQQGRETIINRVRALLERRHTDAGGALWGFKDPRTVLFWRVYETALDGFLRPSIIACWRNPLGVARSWVRLGKMADVVLGLKRALHYQSALMDASDRALTRGWPVLDVSFEDWWRHPERQKRAMEAFLGRELDYRAFDERLWRA